MIDKMIPNIKWRNIIKNIMFPSVYSKYTIIKFLDRIGPHEPFRKQKIILTSLIISAIHYLLFPVFFIVKIVAEKIIIRRLLNNKRKFIGRVDSVCIYSAWFNRYAGGSEAVTANIAQFFETNYPDCEVTILCDDYLGIHIDKPASLEEINMKYGTILKKTKMVFQKHGFFSFFMYKYYINFIKTSMNYDIFVNCHTCSNPSNAAINIHYIHFPAKKEDALSDFMFNTYVENIDSFLANSAYSASWASKILGVEQILILEPPVLLASVSDQLIKKNIILTIGRYSKEKNIETLIKTFTQYISFWEGWEYVIIGALDSINSNYYQYLKMQAEGYPVRLLSNVSKIELMEYMNISKIYWHGAGYGADLMKFPSDAEHFGMTVVEAMSAGCIPLVFEVGGPADIITENQCGQVWSTPYKLATITQSLIIDEKIAIALSNHSQISAKKYSVAKFMEKFGRELDRIILNTTQLPPGKQKE
jgi:glycosyltransferase involved in cell wall biosynthesis